MIFGFIETAILVGHKPATEMLLRKYADTSIRIVVPIGMRVVPQYLGAAAAMLGRHDEARKYYDEAIKVCTEMRYRPGLALTRLQLAELLLEHYLNEKKEALEHLDFAIKEFREMKMQPSLERALRHKDILKA
jgi:tetratricopeptide (TPR) repeat protein